MNAASFETLEFERQRTDPKWSIRAGGLARICDHFSLLFGYLNSLFQRQIRKTSQCIPQPITGPSNFWGGRRNCLPLFHFPLI
jgi:hypothetical protein